MDANPRALIGSKTLIREGRLFDHMVPYNKVRLSEGAFD